MRSDRIKITSAAKRFEVIRNLQSNATDVIRIEAVDKRFRIYEDQKQHFFSLFSKKYRRRLKLQTAIRDISCVIQRGQSVNLIGEAASGKTTLINLIAGIKLPGKGRIVINGRVSNFNTAITGLDTSISGRRNMLLKGQMMGLTKTELAVTIPKAVEFSGLGADIDKPMKRLTKSLSNRIVPAFLLSCDYDILLVDSWIKGIDREFSQKCQMRIQELVASKKTTVIYSSRSPMTKIPGFDRALILKQGRLIYDGVMSGALDYFKDLGTPSPIPDDPESEQNKTPLEPEM
ncbi:MAG: ATP-binding cassette domain-containing protein [Actinomycetia bacterium]|nr:ATP-binding cassette domain-containing protein [Actinomycetes bacterium]